VQYLRKIHRDNVQGSDEWGTSHRGTRAGHEDPILTNRPVTHRHAGEPQPSRAILEGGNESGRHVLVTTITRLESTVSLKLEGGLFLSDFGSS